MSRAWNSRQRGVSLIEAMVAMVIMAVGMLGLAGLQASMRLNADIAKQRAEATRLAQERIEQWRSYDTLTTFDTNMADLVTQTATGPTNTNTTYSISASVTPDAMVTNSPPLRQGSVKVEWQDRSGQGQSVELLTQVAGVSAVLGGSLTTPPFGSPTRAIVGRHIAVPLSAVNQSDGLTSHFVPPNSSGVGWVFDNTTGLITRVCDPLFVTCSAGTYTLVTGIVLFAQNMATPDSENPTSASFDVGLRGELTLPEQDVDCYASRQPSLVVYYCAMPLSNTVDPQVWTGTLVLRGGDLRLASSLTDVAADKHRVCRYTPLADDGNADSRPVDHPRVYTKVRQSLLNQNFLVIRAGDGTTATACPGDGPLNFVNTNTRLHQPAPT